MKVLFVCNGNIFRSMSAEYCFNDYVKKNNIKNLEAHSAGIIAKKQDMLKSVKDELNKFKIDPSKHKQRKINKKIIDESDFIIAMAEDHKRIIKEKFGLDVPLFKEVCYDEEFSIYDIEDVVFNYKENKKAVEDFTKKVVNKIHDSIPFLVKNLPNYVENLRNDSRNYIFCKFLNGELNKHKSSGYPFLTLHETENTISFLSEDIPKGKDSHILAIPKMHYSFLEDIPPQVQHELIEHVSLSAKVLRKHHGACNVLQNDGLSAGQCVFHVHFHLVPRDKDDGIKIELWQRKRIPIDDFFKNHIHLKNIYKDTLLKNIK